MVCVCVCAGVCVRERERSVFSVFLNLCLDYSARRTAKYLWNVIRMHKIFNVPIGTVFML